MSQGNKQKPKLQIWFVLSQEEQARVDKLLQATGLRSKPELIRLALGALEREIERAKQ